MNNCMGWFQTGASVPTMWFVLITCNVVPSTNANPSLRPTSSELPYELLAPFAPNESFPPLAKTGLFPPLATTGLFAQFATTGLFAQVGALELFAVLELGKLFAAPKRSMSSVHVGSEESSVTWQKGFMRSTGFVDFNSPAPTISSSRRPIGLPLPPAANRGNTHA